MNISSSSSSRNDSDDDKPKEEASAAKTTLLSSNSNDDDDNVEQQPPPPPYLDENDAVSVMRLLLRRGYFHDKTNESEKKKKKAGENFGVSSSYDPNEATVIETASGGGTFCTLKHLYGQLRAIMEEQKCCTLFQAAQLLGLKEDDEKQIHRVLAQQQDGDDGHEDAWMRVGDQILTQAHLVKVAQWIHQTLVEQQEQQNTSKQQQQQQQTTIPMISMAQVAREWKWTVDDCARLLTPSHDLGPLNILQKIRDNGTRVYILQDAYLGLENQLRQALLAATRPVSITTLCQERDWEHLWIVQDFLHTNHARADTDADADADDWVSNLPGEWHNGGDTYTPHVYTRQQQETVLDTLLHQSGILLVEELCSTVGIRRRPASSSSDDQEVQAYLYQAMATTTGGDTTSLVHDDDDGKDIPIVFLQECVVNLQIIVPPLEALVQDAVASESWCELDCLPIQLLSSEKTIADAKRLLVDYVLKSKNSDDDDMTTGVVAVTTDGAMFVSRKKVLDLEMQHVRPLIPKLAQARAKEEWTKREQRDTSAVAATASSLLSMEILMQMVTKACPDLARFADDNPSLVQEFCTCAFGDDNAALSKACQEAVDFEVVRLEKQAAALAKSKTSSTSAADSGTGTLIAHHTTAEVSFEDASCFTAACHLVQAYAKFLDYAATKLKDDSSSIELLRQAFFQGVCADFTRRMTQYCLHKYNMDDVDEDNDDGETGSDAPTPHFSFAPKDHDIAGTADAPKQPSFCSPVDIAMRRYPYKTYLSCSMIHDDKTDVTDDDNKRDPLAVLRTVLPGSVGQALARQWALCGKACYETSSAGGDYDHVVDEDASSTNNKCSSSSKDPAVAAFLNHVEEHCLTICGLPFKKLDKKSEKHLLAARRHSLLQSLERATDAKDVLEFTVMILFQSAKNQVVFDGNGGANDKNSSSLLCGPILQLLIQERKISQPVGKALTDLAEQVSSVGDETNDVAALVERVRACGLCKDIAKHTV